MGKTDLGVRMRFTDFNASKNVLLVLSMLFLISCTDTSVKKDDTLMLKNRNEELNRIAERYVKLMLGMDTSMLITAILP